MRSGKLVTWLDRYIFRQLGLALIGVTGGLTALIWLTQSLRFVELGEAPVGIVYAPDAAISSKLTVAGVFPADSHDPVTYPFAVVKTGDSPEARTLLSFMSGPEARAIFVKRGFQVQ